MIQRPPGETAVARDSFQYVRKESLVSLDLSKFELNGSVSTKD